MGDSRKSGRRQTGSASAASAASTGASGADGGDAVFAARPVPPAEPAAVPVTEPVAIAEPAPVARVRVLQLGASLSIRDVSEYAIQFKSLLAEGPTDIDASKLETIDTAGIQLLLAAAAAAQRRGYKFQLRGAQGLKDGAARSLGLNEHLGELAEIVP